jgi:non-specific serine/threonine protein kinase
LPVAVPPLLGLDRTNNLPAQVSSFVGRQQAISEIRHLLVNCRLVTLTGVGGIGKTRLALAVAESVLPDYCDGVWLVELAPVADSALVPATIASALGVRDSGGRVIDQLVDVLRSKAMLVLLDNCEHIVDACAELSEALLRGCRDLQILTTSREPLGVVGEVMWRVPGLVLPDAAQPPSIRALHETEGIQLFVERAMAVRPGFRITEHNAAAVVSVCEQLDGIPLAVELAAARTNVLEPAQIAERLVDRFRLLTGRDRRRPERQRTLHATLDWSYGLLSEQEKWLFERLSVFARGWTLEAAEAVCTDAALAVDEVLELLTRLVDKSLVIVEPRPAARARYRYLDTVRDYATEQLSRRGQLITSRDRHAVFCLDLGDRAENMNLTSQQAGSLSLLEQEHNNICAALSWLIERGDNENARKLCGLVWRLWLYRGPFAEGQVWLNRVSTLPGPERDPLRVKVLHGAAMLARISGDYTVSSVVADSSLALARAVGDLAAESFSFYILASNARFTGKLADAERLYEAGIHAGRLAVQEPGCVYPPRYAVYCELICLEGLLVLTSRRDREAARTGLEEVRARAIDRGYVRVAAEASGILGDMRYAQGDYPAARVLEEELLTIARKQGDSFSMSNALTALGILSLHSLELDRAHALLVEGIRCAYGAGARRNIVDCLNGFAALAALTGDPTAALRLTGAVQALNARLGTPEWPVRAALRQRLLAPVPYTLGPAHAKSELTHGRGLSLDQSVAQALAVQLPDTYRAGGPTSPGGLSPRELEVVALIARGYHNRRIAEELVIAPSTAERHVANILAKLRLATRSQVAVWAVEHAAF